MIEVGKPHPEETVLYSEIRAVLDNHCDCTTYAQAIGLLALISNELAQDAYRRGGSNERA